MNNRLWLAILISASLATGGLTAGIVGPVAYRLGSKHQAASEFYRGMYDVCLEILFQEGGPIGEVQTICNGFVHRSAESDLYSKPSPGYQEP